MLFSDFAGLSKNVTWDYYREIFGPAFKPTDMHPLDDLLARQGKEMEANKALGRYFQGAFQVLRPLPIPATRLAAPGGTAEGCRRVEAVPPAHAGVEVLIRRGVSSLRQGRHRGPGGRSGRGPAQGEIRGPAIGFQCRSNQFARCPTSASRSRSVSSRPPGRWVISSEPQASDCSGGSSCCPCHKVAARIENAGCLADGPPDPSRPVPGSPADAGAHYVRNARAALAVLLSNLEGHEEDRDLISAIRDQMEEVRNRLDRLRSSLCDVAYPFDHAKGQMSLGEYALATVPPADNLGAIYEAADELLGKLPSAYVRMVGRMVVMAEQVERLLGLEPLPDPRGTRRTVPRESPAVWSSLRFTPVD